MAEVAMAAGLPHTAFSQMALAHPTMAERLKFLFLSELMGGEVAWRRWNRSGADCEVVPPCRHDTAPAKVNLMHDAEPLDPSLALAFLLDAGTVGKIVDHGEHADEVRLKDLRLALDGMDKETTVDALAGAAGILIAAYPELHPIVEAARQRSEVRTADPQTSADMASLLAYVLGNPWLLPILAVSLRLLGDNEVKVSKLSIKTRSILADLAKLFRGR